MDITGSTRRHVDDASSWSMLMGLQLLRAHDGDDDKTMNGVDEQEMVLPDAEALLMVEPSKKLSHSDVSNEELLPSKTIASSDVSSPAGSDLPQEAIPSNWQLVVVSTSCYFSNTQASIVAISDCSSPPTAVVPRAGVCRDGVDCVDPRCCYDLSGGHHSA